MGYFTRTVFLLNCFAIKTANNFKMLFKNVIGQQEIKTRFLANIKSGRVSHAQLFLGETGFGTLALALAYAQYLNCTNRQENDSCGICESCKKMETLEHPDLHF